MGPISHSDGHEAPWLVSEFVPGLAAVIEQIVSVEEDPVGQPVVAHELPDVLGRVELGTFGRKGHEREITRRTTQRLIPYLINRRSMTVLLLVPWL